MLVTKYPIGYQQSNAYTVWKAIRSPEHPTREQYLEQEGGRFPSLAKMDVSGGHLAQTLRCHSSR